MNDNNDIISIMRSFFLFKKLNEKELHEIYQKSELERFPANTIIINQGDYGDKIYFIADGVAKSYVLNKTGKEVVVGTIHKGGFFGDLALLINGIRNTSVKSITSCKLYSLSKINFEYYLRAYPSINETLIEVLSQRLGETLHLVREKVPNIIILMKCSDESISRIEKFENYLKKISIKQIIILDRPTTNEQLIKENQKHEKSIILIKIFNELPEYLLKLADYVINFVDNEKLDEKKAFYLTKEANQWQIEHTIRRIIKKTVGVALSAGGSPGAAHIGVLKIFQEEGIPIDYIAGASAGAFIGGFFAFGCSIEAIINAEKEIQSYGTSLLSLLPHLCFNFSGILKNDRLHEIVRSVIGDKNIQDALIPFAAIASDLYTGRSVVFKQGNVAKSIAASCSIPILFEPEKDQDHHLLVDAIATDPLPIQVLLDERIDIKIAVPIPQLDLAVMMKENPKIPTIFFRSRSMMAEKMMHMNMALADVIIKPAVEGISAFDHGKHFDQIIKAGESAARSVIEQIKYLLKDR